MYKRPALFLSLATVMIAGHASAVPTQGKRSQADFLMQNYPPESLAQGEQGTVEFAVDLDSDGGLESCVVTASSGYPRLDAATCDLLVKHANFPPAKTEDGKLVKTTRNGKVVWRLPQAYSRNASLAPRPVSVTAEELEANRLFCKRSQKAGSLVKVVGYCLTKNEWSKAEKYGQEAAAAWNRSYYDPYHYEGPYGR
jgi:TonB family protein